MHTESITSNDDFIDARAVAGRIAYLEFLDDPETYESQADYDLWEDERAELAKLRELEDQIALDAQLIRDSAFEDYAQQFAEDVYGRDNPLYAYVDWDQFASDMQSDYTNVEFDGVTYWYR